MLQVGHRNPEPIAALFVTSLEKYTILFEDREINTQHACLASSFLKENARVRIPLEIPPFGQGRVKPELGWFPLRKFGLFLYEDLICGSCHL